MLRAEDIASIWRELLQVDVVRDADNFVELGGDSIAAVLCANEIQRRCGVEIPVALMLSETLTLTELAGFVNGSASIRTESRR